MDEAQINQLLNSHGFFKSDPEADPEPVESDEPKEEL